MTRTALTILFCTGLAAAPARAQLVDVPLGPTESPQHFAVELKFGAYVPAIDSSPGLTNTPFSDLFGDPNDPKGQRPSRGLLTQIEFDYQFFQRLGNLGIGLNVGFYRKSAPQLAYFGPNPGGPLLACTITSGGAGQPRVFNYPSSVQSTRGGPPYIDPGDPGTTLNSDPRQGCFSGDQNILNIVPLEVLAVYRFDWFDRRFHIPLIPYAKAGLAYYIWWLGTSSQAVANVNIDATGHTLPADSPDRTKAAGGTFGVVVRPGLALDLGAIDRQAQRVMDKELGLNRVSLFGEMDYAWINNFGSPANKTVNGASHPTTLDLSDLTFAVGLSFEF